MSLQHRTARVQKVQNLMLTVRVECKTTMGIWGRAHSEDLGSVPGNRIWEQ